MENSFTEWAIVYKYMFIIITLSCQVRSAMQVLFPAYFINTPTAPSSMMYPHIFL